ncbi:MAG: hypothetical protein ACKVTZ_07950 [Bacteroidia bacterium]
MKQQHFFTMLLLATTAPVFGQFAVGSKAITGSISSWGTFYENGNNSNNNSSGSGDLSLGYSKFIRSNRNVGISLGMATQGYRNVYGNGIGRGIEVSPSLTIGTDKWIPLGFIAPHLYARLGHGISAGYLYNNQKTIQNDSSILNNSQNSASLGYSFNVGLSYVIKKRWLLSANMGGIGGEITMSQNTIVPNSPINLSARFQGSFSPSVWGFGIAYFLKGGEE